MKHTCYNISIVYQGICVPGTTQYNITFTLLLLIDHNYAAVYQVHQFRILKRKEVGDWRHRPEWPLACGQYASKTNTPVWTTGIPTYTSTYNIILVHVSYITLYDTGVCKRQKCRVRVCWWAFFLLILIANVSTPSAHLVSGLILQILHPGEVRYEIPCYQLCAVTHGLPGTRYTTAGSLTAVLQCSSLTRAMYTRYQVPDTRYIHTP